MTTQVERRGLFEFATRQWIEPQLAARSTHVDQLYGLMRDEKHGVLPTQLAEEWLDRFPDLPTDVEAELLDRLLSRGRYEALRRFEIRSRGQALSADRRANWDAVAFVVDFEAQRDRLAEVAKGSPDWFWQLRRRVSVERSRNLAVRLSPLQLSWIFATFREAFPYVGHPSGAYSGDTNPWDASDFLLRVANRLADDTSKQAIGCLEGLLTAPSDRYSSGLRALVAEQERKAVQERYEPVSLGELRAVVEQKPPETVADLQATVLALLQSAQARLRSSPDDAWRVFYDDRGQPRDEERCRDHLLTVLGLHPEGIDLMPEGHLADDKRADIIALRPGMRLPVEVKGQWHPELWRAAETQLQRLYAADYAAERRGIYLVLWFGPDVKDSKKPRAPSRGKRRPSMPEEVREALTRTSDVMESGAIEVVVLDLSRPRA